MRKCQKCKKDNLDEAQYCEFCGSPLEKMMYCSNCGKALSSNDIFCEQCGYRVKEEHTKKKKSFWIIGIIALLIILFITIMIYGKKESGNNANENEQIVKNQEDGTDILIDKSGENVFIDRYAETLYGYVTGDGIYDEYRFALAYIDTDDVPELLVFQGDYHSSMVEVYTVYNNELYNAGMFGSSGCITYASKQNLISSSYVGQGNVIYEYFSLHEGIASLEKTIGYSDYDIETEKESFSIDEKRVSKNEYNQELSKYQINRKWTEASGYNDGYEITDSLIKDMINGFETFVVY